MSKSKDLHSINKDNLIADLKLIVTDSDTLMKTSTEQTREKFISLITRIQKNLMVARGRLDELEVTLLDTTTEATREALQKTAEAVKQAHEAALEAAQKAEESVNNMTKSSKSIAQEAVAATRDAANKALNALSNWIG